MDRFATLPPLSPPTGRVENPDAILFRGVFAKPKYAADLLQHQLPPDLVAAVDWASLRALDLSFVPERHRRDQVDVWFAARIYGREGAVLLLCDRSDAVPYDGEASAQHYLDAFGEQWRARAAADDAREPPPVLPYVMRLPPLPARAP